MASRRFEKSSFDFSLTYLCSSIYYWVDNHHCQRCCQIFQLISARTGRQIVHFHHHADRTRMDLQTMFQKVCNSQRIRHRNRLPGKTICLHLHFNRRIDLDIAEPICLPTARRGNLIQTIDFLILDRSDAPPACLPASSCEQHNNIANHWSKTNNI